MREFISNFGVDLINRQIKKSFEDKSPKKSLYSKISNIIHSDITISVGRVHTAYSFGHTRNSIKIRSS